MNFAIAVSRFRCRRFGRAVILAEKNPMQRCRHWQLLCCFFDPALLLSENIIVKAKKWPW